MKRESFGAFAGMISSAETRAAEPAKSQTAAVKLSAAGERLCLSQTELSERHSGMNESATNSAITAEKRLQSRSIGTSPFVENYSISRLRMSSGASSIRLIPVKVSR